MFRVTLSCQIAPSGACSKRMTKRKGYERELRRNAATVGGGLEYRATTAQRHADRSARRPKPTKLALNATSSTDVEERLAGGDVAPSGGPVPS